MLQKIPFTTTVWMVLKILKPVVNHGISTIPFPQLVSFLAGFLVAINSLPGRSQARTGQGRDWARDGPEKVLQTGGKIGQVGHTPLKEKLTLEP